MAGRLEPGWRFSSLYLIKDSLAVMLRSAGLLQDALREIYELEAVYLNAIAGGGGAVGVQDFGAALTIPSLSQQPSVQRLAASRCNAAYCRRTNTCTHPALLSLPSARPRLPAGLVAEVLCPATHHIYRNS